MGQCHVIYNVDKKEYFRIGGAKLWEKAYSKVNSMGLLVLLSNSNGRGGGDLNNPIYEETHYFNSENKYVKLKKPTYFMHVNGKGKVACTKIEHDKIQNAIDLISGRWSGDRIVIQGDYVKKTDVSFIEEKFLNNFKNITKLIFNAFELVIGDDTDEESSDIKKEIKFEKSFHK